MTAAIFQIVILSFKRFSAKLILINRNQQLAPLYNRIVVVDLYRIQRICQQFQIQRTNKMDYLIKHDSYLDLKIEEKNSHYLFHSLLQSDHSQSNRYFDSLLEDHSDQREKQGQSSSPMTVNPQETMINQISYLYNIRTTPMNELLLYAEQAYSPSQSCRRGLFKQFKKIKNALKRQHAKNKCPVVMSYQEKQEEMVKTEEQGLSPYLFDDESVETKKKKRNRMSAQYSRDKKKQYIKYIQNQNKELKAQLQELRKSNQKTIKPNSRDFLKILLCLGMTCFINTNLTPKGDQSLIPTGSVSSEALSLEPLVSSSIDLKSYKSFLPAKQLEMFDEVIELVGQSSNHTSKLSDIAMTDAKIKKKLEGIIDVDKKSSRFITSF